MSKTIQESLNLPIMDNLFRHSEKSLSPSDDMVDTELTVNEDEQIAHEELMTEFAETAQTKAEDLIELGYSIDPKSAGSVMGAAAKFMSLALEAKKSIRDTQIQMAKLQIEAMKISKMPSIPATNNGQLSTNGDTPNPTAKSYDRNELLKNLTNRSMSEDD